MNKRKLVLSSSIANIFEWYDYTLYAHLAHIIRDKFFSHDDAALAMLNTFAVFAIGYVMRPVGGLLFGVMGDKYGRKVALNASILCMAIPTTLMGILPTYQTSGNISTIAMIIVRMMQGVSMGGALTSSISFTIEHTDKRYRGFVGSISMSSICIGILLGSLSVYLTQSILSNDNFYDFGWRIPFLSGIFIILINSHIRKNFTETPMFERIKQSNMVIQSPIRYAITRHYRDILISIAINSTGSVIFYLNVVYISTYLKLDNAITEGVANKLVNFSYIIMSIMTICFGILSDKIGRRRTYMIVIPIIIISIFPIMMAFNSSNLYYIIAAQLMLSVLAAAYLGPEPALQIELYPAHIRNTALSLSYNIATSLFGGTTPLIMEYIAQKTDSIFYTAYYVLICAILSMISLYFYRTKMDQEI